MKFEDYAKLKQKAKAAGVEDSYSLQQLLHILQAKAVAVEYHEAYMRRMNKWEKNIARTVEEQIRRAGEEEWLK